MSFSAKARRLPGRLAAGAFTLNAGLSKWNADEQTAAALHGMACGTYPFLANMKAKDFARLLSVTEIALGAAVLLPVVPASLAGASLAAYASALLGLYARTGGTRREDGIRPTEQGTVLAKDVWLLGIGLGLVIDGFGDRPASAGR
jgi:roadblock/LC7 domain-containing protein